MIHCDIGGRPQPGVTWIYGNLTPVKNESSRLISYPNGTLMITSVAEEDYGVYFCHASGDLSVSHKVELVQATTSEQEDNKIGKLLHLRCEGLIVVH